MHPPTGPDTFEPALDAIDWGLSHAAICRRSSRADALATLEDKDVCRMPQRIGITHIITACGP